MRNYSRESEKLGNKELIIVSKTGLFQYAIIAVIYYLGSQVGGLLCLPGTDIQLLYIPVGIMIPLVIVYGHRVWPAIIIGSSASILPGLIHSYTLVPAIIITAVQVFSDILQVYFGVFLYRWYRGGKDPINSLGDVVKFVLFAALISQAAGATLGSASLYFGGRVNWLNYGSIWLGWWLANAVSVLIISPLLIVWLTGKKIKLSIRQIIFHFIIYISTAIFAFILFTIPPIPSHYFEYFTLLFVILGIFALSNRAAITLMFIVASIAVIVTVFGKGPFYMNSSTESILLLEIYLTALSITSLLLSSLLTERKRANDELRASKEKAEEMNQMKSSFFNNMSHELRTPMVGILSYAEILRHESFDEDVNKFAGIIYNSGRRLMETLNLILDMSRMESEKLKLIITKTDIVQIIKEVIDLFKEISAQRLLYLKDQIDFDSLIMDTDPGLIQKILTNLISNAIKYTDKGGITVGLFIETRDEQSLAVIKICDTGIGIADENLDLIWEEFRQVSEGKGRIYEGTGLGLTITKKFVEKLGGQISVESTLGKGTTFVVKLPMDLQ